MYQGNLGLCIKVTWAFASQYYACSSVSTPRLLNLLLILTAGDVKIFVEMTNFEEFYEKFEQELMPRLRTAAVAAISSAGASIDHHSSLSASSPDEQQQESSESVLIPWRVAVERDLSQFNADIVHEFEADNTSLFSEAAKDIARESKDKIDKYLKF